MTVKDYTKVDETTQMRDAVIGRLYELSETDKDIIFIAADMGAEALDLWREGRVKQYMDVGIAEQAAILLASGMAKEGKKPFIYAIAPFITSRIHEFHKLNAGIQNLPYNTIGVGTGFCYPDSGPTHHNLEDISIMRTVPNMEILSPSDSVMASEMAEYAANSSTPTYLRLERSVLPIISSTEETFERGFRSLVKKDNGICIVSTGNMVHNALEASKRLEDKGIDADVIDLYRLKPINREDLANELKGYNQIVSLEEHFLAGGLGSILAEIKVDMDLPWRLKRIGIDDKHVYLYGRENIQKELGIDVDSTIECVKKLLD